MKIKYLKYIVENFQKFELIYNSLKDLKSNEYIKNFVELMQNSKRDTIDMIEVPILILNQKSNYLKGKLAYYCENYPKALEYLNRSKEIYLISDATFVKKSIKLIKKILYVVKMNIEKEIIINENKLGLLDVNKASDFKNYVNKIINNRNKIQEYDDYLEKEIEKYTFINRDILILIDISKSMMNDDKKIEKATKNTSNIFENYKNKIFNYKNS